MDREQEDMTKTCALCGENPVSVFMATQPVCRQCHRELRRAEMDDNAVPNAPWCSTCSCLLNASGVCPECSVARVRAAHAEMRRVS